MCSAPILKQFLIHVPCVIIDQQCDFWTFVYLYGDWLAIDRDLGKVTNRSNAILWSEPALVMSVFYSWQLDSPPESNKDFIFECLQEAIEGLNQPDVVMESAERLDNTPLIELDHDTKDVLGTPDIVATILSKIQHCTVFVADVTLTGKSLFGKKPYPNPNVCVEFGYALGTVGLEQIILVMDEAHGEAKYLPFDFKGKRFPVRYSSKKNLDEERSKLVKNLTSILRKYQKQYLERQVQSLSLDWSVASVDPGKFDISFGIRNESKKPVKDVAVRLYNSKSFQWNKITHRGEIYQTKHYDFLADTPYADSVLVKSEKGHVVHVGQTDWSFRLEDVWTFGKPFEEIEFQYDVSSENSHEIGKCVISQTAFANRGRIQELGFSFDSDQQKL